MTAMTAKHKSQYKLTVMVGVTTAHGPRKVKLVTDLPYAKQFPAIVSWFAVNPSWGEIKRDDTQLAFAEVSTLTLYIYR